MCEYAIGTNNGEIVYAECGTPRPTYDDSVAEQVVALIVGASVEQTPNPEATYQELIASRRPTSY